MEPNSGSFMGNAGGQGGDLAAAIARRSGALNQQGAGSATPSVLPSTAPTGNPQMAASAPVGASAGATGASPERVDDAHIILKAMSERLKSQNKIAEAVVIPPKMGV